jgi:hypothetical protein
MHGYFPQSRQTMQSGTSGFNPLYLQRQDNCPFLYGGRPFEIPRPATSSTPWLRRNDPGLSHHRSAAPQCWRQQPSHRNAPGVSSRRHLSPIVMVRSTLRRRHRRLHGLGQSSTFGAAHSCSGPALTSGTPPTRILTCPWLVRVRQLGFPASISGPQVQTRDVAWRREPREARNVARVLGLE